MYNRSIRYKPAGFNIEINKNLLLCSCIWAADEL